MATITLALVRPYLKTRVSPIEVYICVCIFIEHLKTNHARKFLSPRVCFHCISGKLRCMAERHMLLACGRCVLACNLSSSADRHAFADEVLT